jgi:hypothetical protein
VLYHVPVALVPRGLGGTGIEGGPFGLEFFHEGQPLFFLPDERGGEISFVRV